MQCNEITFTGHAAKRMFERRIGHDDIIEAIREGEVVEEYPDDTPFPSVLLLARVRGRALHVVAAKDPMSGHCFVITVYEPDEKIWDASFKRRKKK